MASSEATPAKDRFTSLDTLALVREIRSAGRLFIDKIFDVAPETWEVTLRASGKGKWALLLESGRYAALRTEPGPHAEELGHLAKELRRHLTGVAITGVGEPHGERLLEVEAARTGSDRLRLIAEFFGKGNLLLVRGDRIVAVAHSQTWAHRTVRPGAEYVPPPAHPDPWAMGVAELEASLARSRTDRIRTLAAQLGFGGAVAEELLERGGVPATEPATRDAGRVADSLREAIISILSEVGENPSGFLYRRDGIVVDVEPFASRRWTRHPDVREERFGHFSDASFIYFSAVAPPTLPPKLDPLGEYRRQAERQVAAIAALKAEAERLKDQANAIFAHYSAAEEAVGEASSDDSEGTVTATLGGVTVILHRGQTPRQSAQALFTELKRIQSKIAGAEAALTVTQGRLAAGTLPPAEARAETTEVGRRKSRWYERFRWFWTSEGVLVVAGRDAASNDLIVRRYLGVNDLYVHADVHGAASVIVKHPADGSPAPGAASLDEAGQWAVCYSKAWRAGHGSADAFWVKSDQVSKSPGSGEFVARGSWVIHGTKNWLKDRTLELALGPVDHDGESVWVAAPPAALRARGRPRLILTPGSDRERSDLELEISRELGLSRERLQRLLPAGGISIRRV